MYIDETGDTGHDDTTTDTTSGHDDTMTVTVEGEDYTTEENYDIDGDGTNDTSVIDDGQGGVVAFTDSDGDGDADVAVEVGADGQVEGAAQYNESTGEWEPVDVGAGGGTGGVDASDSSTGTSSASTDSSYDDSSSSSTTTSTTSTTGSGEDITVETPDGSFDAGPATYDTDGDGVADTAAVSDGQGDTIYVTDTDGDGDADVAVGVDASGDVAVAQEQGDDGNWEVTETGYVDSSGNYHQDSASSGSDSSWSNS